MALNIEKRLQLLEALEADEARQQSNCFMGIGVDTGLYKPPSNPYLKKLFPDRPMTASEIKAICQKENLARPYFFHFTDGSKPNRNATKSGKET